MVDKKRGLGRGLDKLLGSAIPYASQPEKTIDAVEQAPLQGSELRHIPVEHICPGPYQPRKTMKQEALEELANSIKEQGIIQPIVVRPLCKDKFEIIAGERRWRAVQLAGLKTVPAIVREVRDESVVAMALIENIQREDLNPIDEALALQRLITDFSMSHQQVAESVGKYRSTITNLLRLLSLNEEVKNLVIEGTLSKGHGVALLALDGVLQNKAARMIVERQLSVRQTEAYVRQLQGKEEQSHPTQNKGSLHNAQWQHELSKALSLPVKIKNSTSGGGTVEIRFKTEEELKNLMLWAQEKQ